ncbi:MAG TPA: hypothetical protein VG797_03105, partial [Phycisphaerales bacterium]|nr:hypothetical protein [Phycisphaerales bacterium]
MPNVVVFDDGKGMLGPLTDLRSAMFVRTGAMTTLERLSQFGFSSFGRGVCGIFVPRELEALERETSELPVNDAAVFGMSPREMVTRAATPVGAAGKKGSTKKKGPAARAGKVGGKAGSKAGFPGADAPGVVLMNGRCVVAPEGVAKLVRDEALVTAGGDVIAAWLSAEGAREFVADGDGGRQGESALPRGVKRVACDEQCLLDRPWDVIRFRDRAIDIDLAILTQRPMQALPDGVIGIDPEKIWIHPEATVYPGVTLDAEQGVIAIEEGAVVRPGAVIIGPAYIGERSTVIDRTLIKGHTAIGPVCKVAGEVGGTIFQSFSNKAHDGHLGDSYVGEWVNFGAGTTNSNLLNTYGEVIAVAGPGERNERTGLQYLGCIVGDHVKFTICTRIMTGSVFGTGCMFAATAPPPT